MSDPLGLLVGLVANLAVFCGLIVLTRAVGWLLLQLHFPPWLAAGVAGSHAVVLAAIGVGWLIGSLARGFKRQLEPEIVVGLQTLIVVSIASFAAVVAHLALRPLHLAEWIEQLIVLSIALICVFRGLDVLIARAKRRNAAERRARPGDTSH